MKHFLNDVEVSPRNREEIGIVIDWTGDPNELKLNTDSIILTREGYDIIKEHIANVGLFEGIPYKIEMQNGVVLDYYVDLLDSAVFNDFDVEVKVKQRKNFDNFVERASGTSFELMLKKGVEFNTIDIPYLIVKDNVPEQMFTTFVTLFLLGQTLADAIRDLSEAIAEITEAGSLNPAQQTATIIRAIARVVYIATLIILITNLAIQLFNLIYPPIRKLKGHRIKELLTISCLYFGYQFESTLLDSLPKLTILPVPLTRQRKSIFDFLPIDLVGDSFNKGVPSASDTTPSVWSLFQALETMFNAKTRINNGKVQLERRDYWQNLVTQQYEPALVLQSERSDSFTYNTGDVWKRYYLHYQLDYNDLHTTDEIFDFHDAEYSTEPTNIVNDDLVSIKNLAEVSIPFSLGKRKEKLNIIERYVEDIFIVIDTITGVFGNGTNYQSTIGNRKGVLTIGQEFFGVTKLLYCNDNGRQTDNYLTTYLSAKNLWDKYHYINQINLDAWVERVDSRVRIQSNDFVNLLNNNFVEINGKICEVLKIEWIDENSFAKLTYRTPSDYPNGKVYNLVVNE